MLLRAWIINSLDFVRRFQNNRKKEKPMRKKSVIEKEHLPVFGVGPLCVAPLIVLTAASIILFRFGIIPSPGLRFSIPLRIAGILAIFLGLCMWVLAVIFSHITSKIKEDTLVTDGIYAYVRNPIYSAFLFVCSGSIFMCGNLYLLFLPPLFWVYLTFFMKLTEEKWLSARFGKAFEDYCRNVNRFIPWFKRKN